MEEEALDVVTVGDILQLFARMADFIGNILAMITMMSAFLWVASQLGLVCGQATPNPAAAPWWHFDHSLPTSHPLVVAEGVPPLAHAPVAPLAHSTVAPLAPALHYDYAKAYAQDYDYAKAYAQDYAPAAPLADAPAAPLAHSTVTPIAHAPAAPLAHSTVTPLAHAPTAPLAHSTVTPLAHAPAAPLAHSTVTPLAHAPAAPLAHSTVAPLAHAPAAPLANAPVAPLAHSTVTPLAHAPAAPLAHSTVTPLADAPVAPLAHSTVTPLADAPAATLAHAPAATLAHAPVAPLAHASVTPLDYDLDYDLAKAYAQAYAPAVPLAQAPATPLAHSSPADTNDRIFSVVSEQVPESHVLLLKDTHKQLQSMKKRLDRLEKMTIAKHRREAEVPENHALLLEDAHKQLQSMKKRFNTLKKMTIAKHPRVKFRTYQTRKRILVTGGAGFVGSHLVDRLMLDGHEVTVVDNLQTGRRRNIETWLGHNNFQFVAHDIVMPFFAEVDQIYHLASPASPPHYMANPVKTIKTNALGTLNMLGLAKRVGARLLLASTSEVYGNPMVHPQPETYWGNVNPIGPRACYDEGKRVAETLAFAYLKRSNVSIAIARIFNTYGPRMHNDDGRAVSNFILQALENKPLTVYGVGQQTRSFQYVSDLVEGLVALMESNHTGPVNIGNPDEHYILEFAERIQKAVGGTGGIQHLNSKEDDPQRRRPDISLAKKLLNWQPKVLLTEGIKKTVEFFRHELERKHNNQRNTYDPLLDWPHISGDCTEEDGTC